MTTVLPRGYIKWFASGWTSKPPGMKPATGKNLLVENMKFMFSLKFDV